jgi:hypothetical protein
MIYIKTIRKIFCHDVLEECECGERRIYMLDIKKDFGGSQWSRVELNITDKIPSEVCICYRLHHAYNIDVFVPKLKFLNYPRASISGEWVLFSNETLFIEGYKGNLCNTCSKFNSFNNGRFKLIDDIYKM